MRPQLDRQVPTVRHAIRGRRSLSPTYERRNDFVRSSSLGRSGYYEGRSTGTYFLLKSTSKFILDYYGILVT